MVADRNLMSNWPRPWQIGGTRSDDIETILTVIFDAVLKPRQASKQDDKEEDGMAASQPFGWNC